jgi:hypothetical protein
MRLLGFDKSKVLPKKLTTLVFYAPSGPSLTPTLARWTTDKPLDVRNLIWLNIRDATSVEFCAWKVLLVSVPDVFVVLVCPRYIETRLLKSKV